MRVLVDTCVIEEMDCIVTRNEKDYAASPVPVYSPAEFLRILEESIDE